MEDEADWYVGVDWASQMHRACVLARDGKLVGMRDIEHGGAGLSEFCDWLLAKAESPPERICIAIEVPHGPIVECLLERGFQVFSINPKQLDRFRDRFTVAGAKDDSRDAHVLGDSLRTDRKAFRHLHGDDPLIVELRAWSRIAEGLTVERGRLTNQIGEQLWRYYPQALELADDLGAEWFLTLFKLAPSPSKAQKLSRSTVGRLLKKYHVRRFDADGVVAILRKEPLRVAPGTVQAAMA